MKHFLIIILCSAIPMLVTAQASDTDTSAKTTDNNYIGVVKVKNAKLYLAREAYIWSALNSAIVTYGEPNATQYQGNNYAAQKLLLNLKSNFYDYSNNAVYRQILRKVNRVTCGANQSEFNRMITPPHEVDVFNKNRYD